MDMLKTSDIKILLAPEHYSHCRTAVGIDWRGVTKEAQY
jgi:hypothetical protein